MAVMLIARFEGDLDDLVPAYDRAHGLIMSRGGAVPSGELRPPTRSTSSASGNPKNTSEPGGRAPSSGTCWCPSASLRQSRQISRSCYCTRRNRHSKDPAETAEQGSVGHGPSPCD